MWRRHQHWPGMLGKESEQPVLGVPAASIETRGAGVAAAPGCRTSHTGLVCRAGCDSLQTRVWLSIMFPVPRLVPTRAGSSGGGSQPGPPHCSPQFRVLAVDICLQQLPQRRGSCCPQSRTCHRSPPCLPNCPNCPGLSVVVPQRGLPRSLFASIAHSLRLVGWWVALCITQSCVSLISCIACCNVRGGGRRAGRGGGWPAHLSASTAGAVQCSGGKHHTQPFQNIHTYIHSKQVGSTSAYYLLLLLLRCGVWGGVML